MIGFNEIQLELPTVIAHEPLRTPDLTDYKPAGVRLAKMLNRYDDHPSSELWREIQSLSREILK